MLPTSLLLLLCATLCLPPPALAWPSHAPPPASAFVARAPFLPWDVFQHAAGKVALAHRAGGDAASRRMRKRAGADGADWEALGWDQVGGSYSIPLEIGTPPRTFYLQLDTASSDLLLASSLCTSQACKAIQASPITALDPGEFSSTPYVSLYNPLMSHSFGQVNGNKSTFGVSFLDGTRADGFVARDSVSWGGVIGPDQWRVGARNQTIGVITSTNLTLASQHVSGIAGLGFPRLSALANSAGIGGSERAPPLLNSLAANGTLAYPVFGLHLDRNTTQGGSLTVGAIDAAIAPDQSLFQWHPVVEFPPFLDAPPANFTSPYLQWSLALTNVTMNGTAITLNSTTYPETGGESWALLDAGASGIFGPIEAVSELFSLVDGSRMVADGRWIVPCNTRQTMSFSFGGRSYVLQPSDWLMGRVSSSPSQCFAWPVALPPSGDGIGWQLGTPFLRAVYSVFYLGIDSLSAPLIGLYPLRNATLSESAINVTSFLDSLPVITATLPNYLLPLPTWEAPPYLFNTTSFRSEIINDTTATYTISKTIAVPSAGLASQTYAPLPLAAGEGGTATLSKLAKEALPTVGPLNETVVEGYASERSSLAAEATASWQNGGGGVGVSGAAGRTREVGVTAMVVAGAMLWALC